MTQPSLTASIALSQDDIIKIQRLTLFDVSTEYLANMIWTKQYFRSGIEGLTNMIDNKKAEFRASLLVVQHPQEAIAELVPLEPTAPDGDLHYHLKRSYLHAKARVEGCDLSFYQREANALWSWRQSDEYAWLQVHNDDEDPAPERSSMALNAWYRDQELNAVLKNKRAYALQIVRSWLPDAGTD